MLNNTNIYPDLLARVKDSEEAMRINPNGGWGWIGWFPISYAIINFWQDNGFLAETPEHRWRLSERGEDALKGKVKFTDIKWPVRHEIPANIVPADDAEAPAPKAATPARQDDSGSNEHDLFTPAGTCRLCKNPCNPFGWISHAKSHIGKGHAVEIIERRKKKVAIMTQPAPAEEVSNEATA
jgi:hypothetical protein